MKKCDIIFPACSLVVDPFTSSQNQQESPAVADKPARRESMPKIAPIRRAYNVVADILVYIHSFICWSVRNLQNPAKFSENSNLYSSRSSKVIDLGVNRKLIYDFLLVTNSNFGRICSVFEILTHKARKSLNFLTPPFFVIFEAPVRGNPLKFCDEIWRQKTRIMGLPGGVEIMKLSFFFLTQYWRVADGQTGGRIRCDPYYPR